MGIQFDPINKYILITSPTTELTALEIYSLTMNWCDDQPTMGYTVPMKAIGKAPLGGGVYTDSIFVLQNGWKIKFWSGTYQAKITGTLITDDETARTVPPDSGNVEVVFQVSSQATITGGTGETVWTQTEKNGVIADVNAIQAKVEGVEQTIEQLPSETKISNLLSTLKPEIIDGMDALLANHLSHIRVEAKPKSIAQALEQKLQP